MRLVEYKNANIHQRHGVLVLEGVDLHADEGELIYVIGRVGSGKTTLLRTLYCENDLDEAEQATVLGCNLLDMKRKDIPTLRRQMGIIFQDFQLLGDRTIYKNLEFVLKATGWKDKAQRDERIGEVLDAVGMEDSIEKMPHELSGGEQQRIAIARAMLNKPKLIIADEPTGNLDPETAEGVVKMLKEISQNGTAVIMATHNHTLVEKHPGTVYKCEHGRLEDITKSYHDFRLADEPDRDNIEVKYTERMEI